jgi:hypothetical protein
MKYPTDKCANYQNNFQIKKNPIQIRLLGPLDYEFFGVPSKLANYNHETIKV